MNQPVLGAESIAWLDEEPTSIDWREAIELIAPAPEIIDGKKPPIDVVARHVSAQFIAGTQGNEVPEILQDPTLSEVIDPVLRDIAGIKGFRGGWEQRHRQVQIALRPELAEVFGPNAEKVRPYFGDPIAGMLDLLSEIAIGEVVVKSWGSEAKCKDMDPSQFHIQRQKGTPSNDEKVVFKKELIELTRVCRGCSVSKECLAYGLATRGSHEGLSIYGGKILKLNRKNKTLIVIDPFKYGDMS